MKATVSIVQCPDYTPSAVLRAVKEAVELLGGMAEFVRPDQRVLIKPNLLSARVPEAAVTTHPAVVEAVVGLAAAEGGECWIGDSPAIGGDSKQAYQRLLAATGMEETADRTGAGIVRFDDSPMEYDVPGARVLRRLLLSTAVEDANVLINVPKLKTHNLTLLSGAVKNLFGCVPGRRKVEFHLQAGDRPVMFAQILVDVLRAIRPKLSVMDAIVGMDGDGPSAGRRRNFGLILASGDPVALDSVACLAAGVDPLDVPMLRLAHAEGLGVADSSKIEVLGESIDNVSIPDFMLPEGGDMVSRIPGFLYGMLRNQLTRMPVFMQDKCTGCHACAKICPVHAISGNRHHLRIDYSDCIRCYCCQEVCPQEAIRLQTRFLRRVLNPFFLPR